MSSWSRINGGQSFTGTGAGSVALTTGWSPAAGNILVVSLSFFGGSFTSFSISDTHNTYTSRGQVYNSGVASIGCAAWTAPVTSTGAQTITATAAAGTGFLLIMVDEYACTAGVGSVESQVSAGPTLSSTTPSPGAITPTGTDLLIAMYASNNGAGVASTIAPSPTFAIGQQYAGAASTNGAIGYALDQTGAQTPVFTKNNANAWAAIGFAIKAATATYLARRTLYRRAGSRGVA